MLNSCILTGNLGADPEIFYSSEGEPVATFNLAFRSSKKKTGWIKITCFQRLAETAERYLHTGRSKTQASGKQPAMSEAQKRAIYNLSRRRGISVEDLEQMSVDAYGLSVENLSSKDASAFIRNLQQAA